MVLHVKSSTVGIPLHYLPKGNYDNLTGVVTFVAGVRLVIT
jgi:hypothetical protein